MLFWWSFWWEWKDSHAIVENKPSRGILGNLTPHQVFFDSWIKFSLSFFSLGLDYSASCLENMLVNDKGCQCRSSGPLATLKLTHFLPLTTYFSKFTFRWRSGNRGMKLPLEIYVISFYQNTSSQLSHPPIEKHKSLLPHYPSNSCWSSFSKDLFINHWKHLSIPRHVHFSKD